MKIATLFLASLTFSAVAVAADAPRLALWVTDSIGMSAADKCNLPAASGLPATSPTLTERDVTAWNADNARWTLRTTRFAGGDAGQTLQDRCFVLAIDGKLIASGVVLSSYSARLIEFPIISVQNRNNALDLQLTAGNQGGRGRSIHVAALDAVLGQRANLERQLQRIPTDSNLMHTDIQGIGREWTAAVRQLIDAGKIREGMPIAEVIKHLGPPTRVVVSEENKRYSSYHWYFATPMHVNPLFEVWGDEGVVRSHAFGSR